MGENESWAAASPPSSPSGLFPNGLLPGMSASVTRPLDAERWAVAEERTAELISHIQPNPPSEDRRNAVARYVRRLIMECFPLQVEVGFLLCGWCDCLFAVCSCYYPDKAWRFVVCF